MPTATLDTNKYRVLREFPGPGGKKFAPGEVVDTSDWRVRNVDSLVQGRYLQAVFDNDTEIPRDLLASMQKRVDEVNQQLVVLKEQMEGLDEAMKGVQQLQEEVILLEARVVSLEGKIVAKKPGRPAKEK